MQSCDTCPFLPTKRQVTVYDSGNRDILFVMDKPSPIMLTGKSYWETNEGKLLANILQYNNISMHRVSYMFLADCAVSKPSASQLTGAIKSCNFASKLGVIRQYKTVVLLGSQVTKAVLNMSAVLKARVGAPKVIDGVKYVCTVNPSSCIVNEGNLPHLTTDIAKIEYNPKPVTDVKYLVIDDEDTAVEYFNTFERSDYLTIDIETATEKDLSYEHPDRYEMLCVGVKRNDDEVRVITSEALTKTTYAAMERALNKSKNIAHNGKFDMQGLYPRLQTLPKVFADTMLMSYVFDERQGVHGLKYIAQEMLNMPSWDDDIVAQVGTNKNFGLANRQDLHKYNAYDVEATYKLFEMFFERLSKDADSAKQFEHLMAASNLLTQVEINGMAVDMERLAELDEEMSTEIKIKERELIAFVVSNVGTLDKNFGYNPRSPLQTKKVLHSLDVIVQSTNVQALDSVIAHPEVGDAAKSFCKMLLEYRKVQKLYSTYVVGIADRVYKGKVHTSFLLHGTVTGRLSSRNPNMQNIPRGSKIKEIFIPSPGKVLMHVDYSQAELRVLSWLAKDNYFREILNDNTRDVFDELVPEIFSGHTKENTDKVQFKELRTMVKGYVYGLAYGRTEYGLAAGFGIDVATARKHMKKFFSTIPDVIRWQESIKRQVMDGRNLVTVFGNKRRYNIPSDDIMREALAFLPQATASHITLAAAIALNNDQEFTGDIVNIVHDDIIVESKPEDVDRNFECIKKHMIAVAERVTENYIRFDVDGKVGDRWSNIA